MRGKSLYDFPIHLGLGAKAVSEPQFTGFEWYEEYGNRHADDLDEGRLVSLFRFEESWTSWEMHPAGEEVVCCLQGQMTLHQELADGSTASYELGPGEYAINRRGAWHTADADGPVVALFITAGKDTINRRVSRIAPERGVWSPRSTQGGRHDPQDYRLQAVPERIQLLDRDFSRQRRRSG